MRPIVIVYATREGQTRKVADYLANHLRPQGVAVQLFDAKGVDEPFQLAGYEAAIVAASIHAGKHEPEMNQSNQRRNATQNQNRRITGGG